MPILKCKMCGGNLNVTDNDTVCTCEYCGTTQTIPLIDSDKKARLFNRANDYRLNNDFSRAYNAYEAIVSENPNESEAYWGMILSEYGVEYVDDPKTGKKIPTCHRTSLKSIKTNNNYLKAIEYADIEGKMIYEDEADQLDKLQKDILSVSSKEKPYDVFICYKESDDNGERTLDSVIAQELYDELTNRGMNVFFARISLEDKFGQNYEPYIYNALRSAKAMLLVTTSSEHCNAPWVKNEWSRYLDFIKNDISRSLIPVIKDMSPYELPDELQKLQVLDLNKIGAKQDLIRGIVKITGKDKTRQDNYVNNTNIDSLLKRANIFLEDGDFKSTEEYCNKVLDIDPENADAYFTKMLSELKIKTVDEIESLNIPLSSTASYKSVLRFGSAELRELLEKKNSEIELICNEKKNKEEQSRRKITKLIIIVSVCILMMLASVLAANAIVYGSKYKNANELMASRKYEEALEIINDLGNYKDSANMAKECNYNIAINKFNDGKYLLAFNRFEKLNGYADSEKYMRQCNERYIEEGTVNVDFNPRGTELGELGIANSMTYSLADSTVLFKYDVTLNKNCTLYVYCHHERSKFYELKAGNNVSAFELPISDIEKANYSVSVTFESAESEIEGVYIMGLQKLINFTDLYGNKLVNH